MGHTPYGYIIRNGKAIIDEKSASQIKDLFKAYLSGLSLADASKKAGINRYHATIARMLTNKQYLGDDFYPQIISQDVLNQAEAEKLRRAQMLGRIRESKVQKPVLSKLRYNSRRPEHIHDDPFKQAEYAYSLIESEVITGGE